MARRALSPAVPKMEAPAPSPRLRLGLSITLDSTSTQWHASPETLVSRAALGGVSDQRDDETEGCHIYDLGNRQWDRGPGD
jgi:hypothetical protein